RVVELAGGTDVRAARRDEEAPAPAGTAQHHRAVRVADHAQVVGVGPSVPERTVVINAAIVGPRQLEGSVAEEPDVRFRVPLAAVPEVDRIARGSAGRPAGVAGVAAAASS